MSMVLAILVLWLVISVALAGLLAFGLTRRARGTKEVFRDHSGLPF